ncbi:elongation of very long chain fatty acids protein AAEL008004-like [Mytilus californianus]|uniref:elongation of very long chain fatty acids protein AAEL008004-like n=1 Tax=Mytilus californianus TaxID=6549 RepID=UPI002247BC01|nr:elongation of very long chain fatty acids protein AAEL008004-like [Mytilus californianus]
MDALNAIQNEYKYAMSLGDPRVSGWFMMSSPWPCLMIMLMYLIFVKIGPTIMEKRKPLELKNVLISYNIALVFLSGYCFTQFFFRAYVFGGIRFGCETVDYSDSPNNLAMVGTGWMFYISKLLEMLDTVFFILKKKFSQVSFLHVLHHFIMPIFVWIGVKFAGGGMTAFFPTINSLVHFFMYTYYGLSAMGPKYQKYLWWKKYMTKFQIIQFVLILLHCSQLLFIDCGYPRYMVWIFVLGAATFLLLFSNFYIQAYLKNTNEKQLNNRVNGSAIPLGKPSIHTSNGNVKDE